MRALPPFPDTLALTCLIFGLAASACAGPTWGYPDAPGRMVGIRVEVEGAATPLYADPRGTGRYYLEAREGARYQIQLENRTGQRLGAVVTVDGLNVISGERDAGQGRMYILDPWGATNIRGWRTSLSDVRRFTFVDEKASYATRSGKQNGRMGWIEVAVYRERGRACCDGRDVRRHPGPEPYRSEPEDWSSRDGFEQREPSAASPAPSSPPRDYAEAERAEGDKAEESRGAEMADAQKEGARGDARSQPLPGERRRGFPGTGWGSRTDDPVVVVSFEPETNPAERLTLRYEYASALRALGIRLWPEAAHDRLGEREHGDWGFAKPPVR